MSEITIPNWTIFGAQHVTIEINPTDENDGYVSSLAIHLDDGSEIVPEDHNHEKCVILITDIFAETIQECLDRTVSATSSLFGTSLTETYFITDSDGEIISDGKIVRSTHDLPFMYLGAEADNG